MKKHRASSEESNSSESVPQWPQLCELEKTRTNQMLDDNVIELANTERESFIVFDPKRNSPLRFRVIYRRSSSVTIRDSYLVPRKDECFDSLLVVKVLISLNATAGYWQIEMNELGKNMTAFVPQHHLFQ